MPQQKLKYADYKTVSLYYESLDDERPRVCTDRQRRFLEKAKQQATKSSMGHRHGCVVVLDDTIIAAGYNHLFMQNCHHYSMHSEVDAIMKVKKRMRPMLPQCELYVVRIAPNSMDQCLKYSKPCDDCTAYIKKVGIKKVYYSTNYEFEAMLQ
jgi:deoxycytidylate deaminase